MEESRGSRDARPVLAIGPHSLNIRVRSSGGGEGEDVVQEEGGGWPRTTSANDTAAAAEEEEEEEGEIDRGVVVHSAAVLLYSLASANRNALSRLVEACRVRERREGAMRRRRGSSWGVVSRGEALRVRWERWAQRKEELRWCRWVALDARCRGKREGGGRGGSGQRARNSGEQIASRKQ